ncbi:MAG: hypothetical protein ACT4QF_04325 [Sporichthyaceae bacterium]
MVSMPESWWLALERVEELRRVGCGTEQIAERLGLSASRVAVLEVCGNQARAALERELRVDRAVR